jgi:hypothetical protein
VKVERVIADSPCDSALLTSGRGLVGLALYAMIHDMVPADGAVVNYDIPRPQRHGGELFDFEPLLALAVSLLALGRASGGGLRHLHIGHVVVSGVKLSGSPRVVFGGEDSMSVLARGGSLEVVAAKRWLAALWICGDGSRVLYNRLRVCGFAAAGCVSCDGRWRCWCSFGWCISLIVFGYVIMS